MFIICIDMSASLIQYFSAANYTGESHMGKRIIQHCSAADFTGEPHMWKRIIQHCSAADSTGDAPCNSGYYSTAGQQIIQGHLFLFIYIVTKDETYISSNIRIYSIEYRYFCFTKKPLMFILNI